MTAEQIEKLWEAAQAEWANACGGPMEYQIFGRMVAEEAVKQEREACAKLVQEYYTNGDYTQGWQDIFAERIRAR